MAMRSRPTIMKRQRERARQEKAKEKFAKRLERQPEERSAGPDGVDPDLADIKAGPQPLAEWQIDEEPAKKDDESDESEDADATTENPS